MHTRCLAAEEPRQRLFWADSFARTSLRPSLSLQPPQTSHSWVFATITLAAAAVLSNWYLSPASGKGRANQAQQASFLRLKASFNAGVQRKVVSLPPHQAPKASWHQLWAATSTNGGFKRGLSKLHVLSLSQDTREILLDIRPSERWHP